MAVYHKNLQYHKDTVRKHRLQEEEINFLMELQKEMNTQDNVGQADPRFWVILGSEKIYSDRDSFEEDFEEWLWEDLHARLADEGNDAEMNEDTFQSVLKRELEQYEPYWKNCIIIRADN